MKKRRKHVLTHLRIACLECDTMEGDGLTLEEAKEAGWTEIGEQRSGEQRSVMIWWDHLGLCPDCGSRTEEP